MIQSDQEFREEYKPLLIPTNYSIKDTLKNKIVYALAQLGEGDVAGVTSHIFNLEPGIENEQQAKNISDLIEDFFNKGLIKGTRIEGSMVYNLSKITHENKGSVDPDMLAPGLD